MKQVELNGLTVKIEQDKDREFSIISGGMKETPTWEEYKDMYVDEVQDKIELIKMSIIENDLVGETGQSFANDKIFVFSDGTALGFTWRAWGDLMSAIVGKKEGYMAYYM